MFLFCSVLLFSHPWFEGWPRHGCTFSIYLYPMSFWLTLPQSPVHELMLSLQAVRGLPCLHAPGIVPSIISYSRQFLSFLMVWPQYASFLAFTVSSLLQLCWESTHLFSLLSTKHTESFSCIISHWFIWTADKPQPLSIVHNIQRKIVRTWNVSECSVLALCLVC